MCKRCKRWLVFSDEEFGYSFKEARRKEYECGMCKLEKGIEDGRKKRMEIKEKVNVLVAELERQKNVRKRAEVKARNLREKVDRLTF